MPRMNAALHDVAAAIVVVGVVGIVVIVVVKVGPEESAGKESPVTEAIVVVTEAAIESA